MTLAAGDLRDRINIQMKVRDQDPVTGETVISWANKWTGVPAKIEDMSQRDQLAAQAMQSHVSARIILRFLPGLDSSYRIVDIDGQIYSIEGPPIRDKDSRREFMTLSVSRGASDGS